MASQRRLSAWAAKFLQRECTGGVVPPPSDEPMQDFILQNFAVEHKDDSRRRMASFAAVSSDGSASESESLASRAEDSGEASEKSDDDSDSDSDSGDEGGKSLSLSRTRSEPELGCEVMLSNLPYAADEEELRDFCEDYGTVSAIDMRRNASGTFAGDAVVTFAKAAEGLAAAKGMQGTDFSGREVRARTKGGKSAQGSRKGGDAARYFGGDVKATRRAKRFPCFLCAELGHQASSCHRVLCNRCGHMGHQARNCTTPPRAYKPRVHLCARCGSLDHSTLSCPNRGQLQHLTKLTFLAQCLVCRSPGHIYCGDAPPAPPGDEVEGDEGVRDGKKRKAFASAQLFCANCAKKGHQDHDCPSNSRSSHAPKRMRVESSRCVSYFLAHLSRSLLLWTRIYAGPTSATSKLTGAGHTAGYVFRPLISRQTVPAQPEAAAATARAGESLVEVTVGAEAKAVVAVEVSGEMAPSSASTARAWPRIRALGQVALGHADASGERRSSRQASPSQKSRPLEPAARVCPSLPSCRFIRQPFCPGGGARE